jgi:hypothetical protein
MSAAVACRGAKTARQAIRRRRKRESLVRCPPPHLAHVHRIPAAPQATRAQIGLQTHRQQKLAECLPRGRGQPPLYPAHRRLRGARATSERALTQAELLAMLADEGSRVCDT